MSHSENEHVVVKDRDVVAVADHAIFPVGDDLRFALAGLDHEDDGYRAQLHTKSQPTAVLSLLGVTEKDAGTYKCRVDFKRSPTRYWKVNIAVIGE